MIYLVLALFSVVSNAAFGYGGGYAGGFGMPMMPTNRFGNMEGVQAKQAQIRQTFPDSVDSKPLAMMIAAGMLPRYAPMGTDGVDAGDAWLGGNNGETEAQVIQRAKSMYPMSAQLGHPENEELMPMWHQVVLAGLTRAPDHTGHNDNTRSHASHGFGFSGESEFGHPEYEHPEGGAGEFEHPEFEHPETEFEGGFNHFTFASGGATATGGDGTGANPAASPWNTFGFGAGFGGEIGESGVGEHSEDICPTLPPAQCRYPCMKFGNFCTGELLALRKSHLALKMEHAQSESKAFSSVDVLYCLWGLTTGIMVGGVYMLWSRKTVPQNLDHYERA